jgi:putative Mg2+ transporter-C (MgtC) family protein
MAELSNAELIGRLLLAAVLGAAVGAEREINGHEAGLRTHLMLSLGAALFGLISVGAWDHFSSTTNATNYRVDVTRVASYVAAGIGFIGAGTIVKHAGGVRGLTTAASLWVVAAIGLASGVGFVVPAVTATVVALLSLYALRPLVGLTNRLGAGHRGSLVVLLDDERAFGDVVRIVQQEARVVPSAIRGGSNGGRAFEVEIDYPGADTKILGDLIERIAALPHVSDVHLTH